MWTSALVGALVVVLSDLVARRLFAPTELPVGVVTGIVGAPVPAVAAGPYEPGRPWRMT